MESFSGGGSRLGLLLTEWHHAAEATDAGIHLLYPPHELAACVNIHA